VAGAAAVGGLALLAGPAAYAATTIGSTPSGGNPTAGPATSAGFGGPGGAGSGFVPGGGAFPFGAPQGAGSGQRAGVVPGGAADSGSDGASGGGPGQGTVSSSLVSYLEKHRGTAEYLVAVEGSQSADGIILATGDPVMAMGGFTGSDPYPTLAEFRKLVAEGKVRYVLVGGGGAAGVFGGRLGSGSGSAPGAAFGDALGAPFGSPGGSTGGIPNRLSGNPPLFANGASTGRGSAAGPGGGSSTVSAVTSWVETHGEKVTVAGASGSGTLYEVSRSAASAS
jgi:hypothetical protein